MAAVLDTHAAVWYFQHVSRLSSTALQTIRRSLDAGSPIYVSCISLIETVYLVERGRLPREALQRLETGATDKMSGFIVQPIDEDVAEAFQKISSFSVPEMPDRIIAATALHLGIPLITRDQRLQASGIHTIW